MSVGLSEEISTSDLDLLDDDTEHGICTLCTPYTPGVPYIAVCGKEVIDFGPLVSEVPPHMCPDCRSLIGGKCPNCGKVFG